MRIRILIDANLNEDAIKTINDLVLAEPEADVYKFLIMKVEDDEIEDDETEEKTPS